MNIYLLVGGTGEYSDRLEWFVRCYRDESQAHAECVKLNKLAEGLADLEDYVARAAAVKERLMPHDAQAQSDYTGTAYYVVEIPLV